MRSLTLISTWEVDVPPGNVTATTYDLDEHVIYVASERNNPDGEVEIELWKIEERHTRAGGLVCPPFHLCSGLG